MKGSVGLCANRHTFLGDCVVKRHFLIAFAVFAPALLVGGTVHGQEIAEPEEAAVRCVETDAIVSYKVENDELVKIQLADTRLLLMRLKTRCPQLYFHRYITYTPTNGRICAGVDEIRNRAGLSCRIESFETLPTKEVTGEQVPKRD